ncbi:MAG: hypothetical protein EB012_05390 [Gammaproteobacteria bacterium]|nr:hypothetical protein [Gammaproteobacteria bacterium]
MVIRGDYPYNLTLLKITSMIGDHAFGGGRFAPREGFSGGVLSLGSWIFLVIDPRASPSVYPSDRPCLTRRGL